MQNIDKTDINSPGSTSQQEHRQERALKAVRNRGQVRLSAEPKEQRQAKLETERDSGIDEDNRHLRQRQHLHAQGRQRNESGYWIITENRFQHSFNFELVQDRDRKLPQFSSTLANDFNGGTATSWITRIKTEYFFDDKDRS